MAAWQTKAGRAIKPGQGASNLAPPLQPLPEELQDCAAYPVAGQRQRPRGEAAEGKAWLAVLSFTTHPPNESVLDRGSVLCQYKVAFNG